VEEVNSMRQNKRNVIKNLVLNEISHVSDPANKGSTVVLWKRADATKGGDLMTPEELTKKLEELETQVSDLEKSNMDYKSKYDKMMEAMKKAGVKMEEKDGEMMISKSAEPVEEYLDIAGEKIAKSSIPAPVLAQLEKSAKEADDLRKAAEYVELKKRAVEAMPNMAGTEDHKAHLMKAVESIADEAVREEIVKSIKAADAAVKKSFEERGSDHVDETSPAARLEKMAQDYAAEKGMTYHSAYVEVIKTAEGRKLATEVQNRN
jgi:hypothetical protein